MSRGYRGYGALEFVLPFTPTNVITLENSFFWIEMKGLKSFKIPLKRKGRKNPKAEKKTQSEASPKYPFQGQSNERYKTTLRGSLAHAKKKKNNGNTTTNKN